MTQPARINYSPIYKGLGVICWIISFIVNNQEITNIRGLSIYHMNGFLVPHIIMVWWLSNFIFAGLHKVMRARLLCAIRGVKGSFEHSSLPKSRQQKGQAYGLS